MKIDGLMTCSKRGFERHLCSADDDDKQRGLTGRSARRAGQPAKSWQDILVIAVLSFGRNYSPE